MSTQDHVFCFGYQNPVLAAAERDQGWDGEASSLFIVRSESAESALAWGCEVVEKLVHRMFSEEGWEGAPPSWKASQFGHWIEDDEEELEDIDTASVPMLNEGEMPDLAVEPWRAWWDQLRGHTT